MIYITYVLSTAQQANRGGMLDTQSSALSTQYSATMQGCLQWVEDKLPNYKWKYDINAYFGNLQKYFAVCACLALKLASSTTPQRPQAAKLQLEERILRNFLIGFSECM